MGGFGQHNKTTETADSAQKSEKRQISGDNSDKKNYMIFAIYILICLLLFVEAYIYFESAALHIRLLAYIGIPITLILGIVFFFIKKQAIFKLLFSTVVFIEFAMLIYIILVSVGIFDKLTDMEEIRRLILSTGVWGKLVFCLVQLCQVIILPVPAVIFYLVGLALYGANTTFILSTISVIVGSLVCFGIGRVAGERVVSWIVGKEDAAKYRKFLGDKGRLVLIIMLVFPFFPDDMLCMVAGLTSISWLYFTVVVIITRTINVALTCYFGSGAIIPFSGWGIAVWAAIFAIFAVAFFLVNKNQDKIYSLMQGGRERKKILRPRIIYPSSTVLPERIKQHSEKEP